MTSGGQPRPRFRPSRMLVIALVVVIAVAAVVVIARGGGRMPTAGAKLTAGMGFTLSGTVGNLTPGIGSTLTLTANNSYSVPITLSSVTVSVPTPPSGCPASNLTINGNSFAGSPASVTVGGLSQVVAANGMANVSLPIQLGRAATNGCQNVTFPFNYTGSASYTEPTTTTLAAAPNPSAFGQSVTFTATVGTNITPASAATTPVGSVTFYECTTPANLPSGSPASSCTTRVALSPAEAVNGTGQATFSSSTLAVGSHVVFAVYAATDPTSFNGSSSTTVTQTVGQAATTTVLISAPNPSTFGQPVTLTGTVAPSSGTPSTGPTGTVSFYLGTPTGSHTLLGTGTLNSSGKATLTASSLPGGTDSLYAVYGGDGNFLGSTSPVISQSVTFTSPCIVTTINGTLTVHKNEAICINSPGRVNGTVTVQSGGALALNGATLNGGLTTTGASALRFCSSQLNGNITISGTTGFIVIGDAGDDGPPGCAGNTMLSPLVTVSSNTGGFEFAANHVTGVVTFTGNTGAGPTPEDAAPEVEGNTIVGNLSCTASNNPPLTDGGQKNAVSGLKSGQCSAAGF